MSLSKSGSEFKLIRISAGTKAEGPTDSVLAWQAGTETCSVFLDVEKTIGVAIKVGLNSTSVATISAPSVTTGRIASKGSLAMKTSVPIVTVVSAVTEFRTIEALAP